MPRHSTDNLGKFVGTDEIVAETKTAIQADWRVDLNQVKKSARWVIKLLDASQKEKGPQLQAV